MTADIAFDYSNLTSIANPSNAALLKRADASSPWTDVTANFVHDTTNRTFSASGIVDFSEYSIGTNSPTAVTIGKIDLQSETLDDFLAGIGVGQLDKAALLEMLGASDLDLAAALADADPETILAALKNDLDPDGDDYVVLMRWETLSQLGTVGFFVERYSAQTGWQRINHDLLPAMIDAPMGAQYTLADPQVFEPGSYRYRLIEQEAWGSTQIYGPFLLELH